jgi:hypothetical protein
MKRTHEQLHLRQIKFCAPKDHGHARNFIWIITFFDEVFEYGGDSTFWGYVEENAELLCVEFCNFVQRHIFVIIYVVTVNVL